MRFSSFKFVIAILGLALAVACATEPQPSQTRAQRRSYLDQINTPLTDSWNGLVKNQIAKLKAATASVVAEQMTVTVLAAVGGDGRVQSVRLYKSSGIKAVDELALDAFRSASPLPPPPGYVLRGGLANVHWDFNLRK